MTAKEIIDILRRRYDPNAYAFLEQVANGTGANQRRWADAIVMSLWPSRGLEIIGFEVKVSRSDWLAELKNPEKAEAVAQYCDRWYIAAGSRDIVRDGELPRGWGLMVPDGKGGMRTPVIAQLKTCTPIDRSFMAAVLRNVARETADPKALSEAYDKGFDAGFKKAGRVDHTDEDKLIRKMTIAGRHTIGFVHDLRNYLDRIERELARISAEKSHTEAL